MFNLGKESVFTLTFKTAPAGYSFAIHEAAAYANCTSNAEAMRTQTDCSANTSPKAQTYPSIAKRSKMR